MIISYAWYISEIYPGNEHKFGYGQYATKDWLM